MGACIFFGFFFSFHFSLSSLFNIYLDVTPQRQMDKDRYF